MAEAEDVIVDVARHATVFVRDLWQRHRSVNPAVVDPSQLLQRLDLVVTGVFGNRYPLRIAQPPAPPPWVRKWLKSHEQPASRTALPATDGSSLWLPMPAPGSDLSQAVGDLRIMTLQQAARAQRGAAQQLADIACPIERAVFEVLEAAAADVYLLNRLPGLHGPLNALRMLTLSQRPALTSFPLVRRPLEQWTREIMKIPCDPISPAFEPTVVTSRKRALEFAAQLRAAIPEGKASIASLLYRDCWTGILRAGAPGVRSGDLVKGSDDRIPNDSKAPRSARLTRRPEVRESDERDESTSQTSPWMIQTAQPLEHAEDPFGMQRPADRDDTAGADELADSVSELAEARLVSTPGAPAEVLLSDDPPVAGAPHAMSHPGEDGQVLRYPEWDWRTGAYREPGAAVHQLAASHGPREWVSRTLEEHRTMLSAIRRQFEALRSQRTRLRQQPDGDDIDLDACIDGYASARAGAALPSGLYQTTRVKNRELAVMLLVDTSGSTDGWVSNQRRIIDVEREALLLVCLALESLGEPYGVISFSGKGPDRVTVRELKSFSEKYGDDVALRIAGLEPEDYTRAGAALRHAAAALMRQPAQHRLLLMLSDGKPNDVDAYDGRYGVEDMRQAVVEARLQGIFPFCLTVDRHTANYLPQVFGEHQYTVLHRPELLPAAMLGWLRRLVTA